MNAPPAFQPGWWVAVLAGCVSSIAAVAAEIRPAPVDFDRDVRPIFESSCLQCHGPEKPRSRFRLDNAASALKGGSVNTNDIVPFKSADSQLIDYVSGRDQEMQMPPAGKGKPLTPEQIAILRDWIDQGARWSSGSAVASRPEGLSVTPMTGFIGVTGNKQKFRADTGQTDGLVIGFEDFELKEPVGKESEFIATGHAIFDQHDYKVGMALTTPDLGFVDGGYSTFRKYFNDVGGYYAPFGLSSAQLSQPPFVLNQNLYVDNQKAWINLGLTLPNLPKLVIGYEYLSRSGQESTLNWSQYSTNPTALYGKAILPAYRNTTETTQVIKLDATHDMGGYSLEDNFRGEFYRLNQSSSTTSGSLTLDGTSAQSQSYDQFQAVNVFRVEKQYRPWLLLSGGCLYTHLNGDASLDRTAGSTLDPTFSEVTQGQGISLKQTSHTVNGNALLGPWQGLTFSLGLQADWEKREGGGNLLTGFDTNNLTQYGESSSRDRTSVQEGAVLRYTRIPFTVLYAEARFEQEWYDLYEGSYDDTLGSEFMRNTDSSVNLQVYGAGFSVSPWQLVALDASYQYRDKRNNYDNNLPAGTPLVVTNGYPAFFRWLETTGDEVEARLTLRPCSWLKTTLKYQWLNTQQRNDVYASRVPFFPPLQVISYPGGELLSGDTEASIYSINLTLTPVRRLYLSTSFSYSDTRTVSGINNYPGVAPSTVAPYQGDIYSVLVSANYSLNKWTDLSASYAYSKANYQQDNLNGLPLGIVYDRNVIWLGITRRFTRNLSGRVQYAFSTYNEPSSAQVNNYRANAILCSLNMALP